MAELTHHLKVNIDPEAMNDIKRALHKDIAEVAEQAFKDGWKVANTQIPDDEIEYCWQQSETKKKLDIFLKS